MTIYDESGDGSLTHVERNLIMEHFKKKNELGYEYARICIPV
ncbi:MAG: hypothetical protein H6Q70_4149 [Firmicutes bacterium]|nr:hypothetical protein [Bacillota bacterium]